MTTTAILRQLLETSLGFVYPGNCQVCLRAAATAPEGFVCPDCWQKVRFIKSPFCKRCGLPYEGDITTPFECENCRDVELHFASARSAV
ncbi:MAG TPA: double zinc ribbon domain-containing protein, partial [Candidatus Cybelea sp.]|nr:double zinc ribbon domain-containing protein [Candidatus Cybelea sp.]